MARTPAWPPASLPRLYVEGPLGPDMPIALDRAQANYLGNVLRLATGDDVLLFDGRHGEWHARITAASKKAMQVHAVTQVREQETVPDVTLVFAPVKKGKVDFLIEKAVELGVRHLQPVITERTIVRSLNLDRMRAHIIEAAEQCGRTALATIAQPIKLERWLSTRGDGALYFADENGGANALESYAPPPATILTGPEGGFTDKERGAIRATPGATAISLGPRILRAETAALAAIATYMAGAGDWSD